MTSLDFEEDEQQSHDDDPSIASRTSSSKQLLSQQSALSLSLSSQHSSTASSIRVKKSQTSVYAAQGAGESRMVQDDCGYYCSTILSGNQQKSPAAVLQAAIELAALLSRKSTRAQLWKQDTTSSTTSRNNSILNAILTVLGAAAAGSDKKKQRKGIIMQSPKKNNSSSSTLRTQSARRKLQQQSSQDVTTTSTSLADGCCNDYDLQLLLLLRQALCCCLYFVSWDATLHKDHSVGSRRQRSTIALSRSVRTSILNHKTCLQGICQLTLTCGSSPQDSDAVLSAPSAEPPQSPAQAPHDDHVPTSASYAASGGTTNPKPKRRRLQMKTFRSAASAAVNKVASVDRKKPPAALDAMDFLDDNDKEEEATTTTTSMSTKGSMSAYNNNSMKPPPPRSSTTTSTSTTTKRMGDPTAQGRRNRRQRKRQLEQAQQLQGLVAEASPSLSFASSSSLSKTSSPPRSRKARLAAAAAAGSPTTSSSNISSSQSTTTSSSSNNNKDNLIISSALQDKLEALVSRVELYPDVDYHVDNDNHKSTLSWCSLVALQALHRIVSGKDPSDRHDPSEQEEHDLLRLDDTDTTNDEDDSEFETKNHDDDEEDDAMDNPILRANRALRNSGMLPTLATSLMEALVEARSLLLWKNHQDSSANLSVVHHRIQLLSTLLDGACLFDARNRTILCHDVTQDPLEFMDTKDDKDNDPASSCVVAAALALLEALQSNSRESSSSSNHWSDIQLCCLRTLTSLSHENPLCATQIMAHQHQKGLTSSRSSSSSGLDVMAQIFYRLEETTLDHDNNKKNNHHHLNNSNEERRRFDASICCLNILANVLETGQVGVEVRSWMLRPLKTTMTSASAGGKSESDSGSSSSSSWLTWFSKWVVHKTESFRDNLVTPGSKRKHPSDSEEDVPSYRDEDVVAAGNGCVLLACLLLSSDDDQEDNDDDDNSVTQDESLRTMILDEIPNSDVRFIINCMRAFCNFYAATVGQLSVAIVLPVQKLISQLEKEWGLTTCDD